VPPLLLALLVACSSPPSAPPPLPPPETSVGPRTRTLRLAPAEPLVVADGLTVLAELQVDGRHQSLDWTTVLRQGERYGDGAPFGTVLDQAGAPIQQDGAPRLCAAPDFSGVLSQGVRSWMFTHEECGPAGMFLSELDLDPTGHPRAVQADAVSGAGVDGLDQLCSGSVSPWGSLLSGEEYETDAALLAHGAMPGQVQGRPYLDLSEYASWRTFFGPDASPSPYGNGQVVESVVSGDDRAALVKHPAMGRFSHEVVLSMPDQRTVYMTDDHSHGGLFMFLADQPGDLSAGTLYAARFSPTGAAAALGWVSLGHATDAEVKAGLAAGISFDQLLLRKPLVGGACPEGLVPHREEDTTDVCLGLRPGMELLASRLETRRMAALLGATTELEKQEGLALDPEGRRLFVAFTRIDHGMLAQDPPWPERDQVALPKNACGEVWSLSMPASADGSPLADTDGAPIDSAWVATTARPLLQGQPLGDGGCAEEDISNPDNLAWLATGPGKGILLVAEDTDRSPNRLWAWQEGLDGQPAQLLPVLAAPEGAEVSGLGVAAGLWGHRWITVSIQHPAQQAPVVGMLGPLPPAP